jgi:putative inorganic carbon (hco3(-)) transporter
MPLKAILFIGLFAFCVIGALFSPFLGVYGYIAEYCIGPANAWWAAPFYSYGLRYSFILAVMTTLGFFLHKSRMQYGKHFFRPQEILILFFFAVIWLSVFFTGGMTDRYLVVDHPAIKITKIFTFAFLMTHIITDKRKLNGLFWVFVIVSLILGLQAWDTPRRAFSQGRLEGIGGADFTEANYFSAFMATMLPIVGIQFFRCKKLFGKIVCFISAAFTANAVVLCRSRGAFVGLAFGAFAAASYAPKRYRIKILLCLILGISGGIYLTDARFIERLTTIARVDETRDVSAQSRLDIWKGGMKMVRDHPLGIGAGNWYDNIVKYVATYGKLDSHNTFVKCIAELGFHGFIIFLAIVIAAYRSLGLYKRRKVPAGDHDELLLISFAAKVSLTTLLACCMTMTLLYAEFLWILLCLPICIDRAVSNSLLNSCSDDRS